VFTFTGAHLSSSPSTKPGQLHAASAARLAVVRGVGRVGPLVIALDEADATAAEVSPSASHSLQLSFGLPKLEQKVGDPLSLGLPALYSFISCAPIRDSIPLPGSFKIDSGRPQ
jgi:hypothetical protein